MKILHTLLIVLLTLSCTNLFAEEIDRKTFSMTLPKGWSEDVADDMHDPDSFVFFENDESCLFAVIVGIKSTGISSDDLVTSQVKTWKEKLTDATSTEIKKWSNHEGQGVVMEGKMLGIVRSQATIFGFETADHACVVLEFATLGDMKTFAEDFAVIRKSFKLK